MNNRIPRSAVRVRLLSAGIALALAPALAGAQQQAQPQAEDTTTLDRIEVTGSRIRQVDTETAAPVVLISRENIEKQGFRSVADILQNIPAAGSPAISRTSPLSSGEEVGGYYIDIRNLGANRTLILLNGKRLGISNGGLQDVASIPAAMVERIEVLKDGASTIYGSDAIAGVVNIITRQDFEGAEANAYVGQWGEGDGQRQVYDFTMGFTGDRGSLTAGVEYTKEDPVFARNRWFAIDAFPTGEKSPPLPGGRSGTTQFGRFSYNTGQVDANGNAIFANRTLRREQAGLDPRNFANYRNSAGDTSNPAEQSTVYSGIERKSVFLNGRFDITDSVSFETDILYTDRESFAQNAGFPFQSAVYDVPMSVDSYFNPVGNQAAAAGTLPAGVTPQDIQFVRRGWEVPRQVQNNLTTYRFSGALTGAFEIGERFWDWDVGYLYNQNKGVQLSTGNLNTLAVGQAVGPSFLNSDGVVQCGTAANPIQLGVGGGQCTPWNPLVPFGYGGANTAADANVRGYLYLPGQALSETETSNYFANISGTLATLPAGDLGIAVGVEHRKESGFFSPDALAQTGISTDLAGGPTSGEYSLDEIYAELQVPLLADLPGAQELTLSLASRYSDYDTFGDTTNNKFGLKWKPVDSVLVRGTYADGFRARRPFLICSAACRRPSTASPILATRRSVRQAAPSDACRTCRSTSRQPNSSNTGPADGVNEQTYVAFLSGSNPELTPELSTSKTLGLVWSPGFAEGLNLSLDWWQIKIENTIIADTVEQALNDCYLRGIEARCNSVSGTQFTRDPVTGAVDSATRAGINAGYQETEGYDFDVSYRLPTDYGNFTAAWLSTYVTKNELKTDNLAENPPQQLNGFGGNFRVRSNLTLSWDLGEFGVSWTARYYSGVKDSCYDAEAYPEYCTLPNYTAPDLGGNITPQNEIGSNTFHDVQFRWTAPWNATGRGRRQQCVRALLRTAVRRRRTRAIRTTADTTSAALCT